MNGHEHAVRRALVAPAFRGRELRERFLPVIERNARELIDGTRMTDQDITSFVSLLLSAGGETTDKAITGMFRNLLAHPDQLAAVRADRDLVPAAFAESLRHSPPLQMIMRQTAAEVTLSGGTVPGRGHGHLPDRRRQPRRVPGTRTRTPTTSSGPT